MAWGLGWAGKDKISLENLVNEVGFECQNEHTLFTGIAMTMIYTVRANKVKQASSQSL